ncbi:MAG TPA: EAL domain-containing protein [Herbaspirillum sp.]|jgi:diguanylate cyclase (GGDEF)-like protein/PAS domain S-box-containing protein
MLRKIKANIPTGCAAIALIGLFLVAGIWSYALNHVRDETASAAANEVEKNENLVLAMEEQTIRVIRNIDQLLLIIKDQVEQTGNSDILKRLIKARVVDTNTYTFAGVTNAKGDVVASLLPTPLANLGDLDYFLHHKQDRSDRLQIGKPRVGRFSGRRVILFTRRINQPDGAFGGVVIIGIDPRVFSQLYEKPHFSPSTIISLIASDGGILARRVALYSTPESTIRNQALLEQLRSESPNGFSMRTNLAGAQRFVSGRSLRDYHLSVVISTVEAEAMDHAQRQARDLIMEACMESAMVLLFCGLLCIILLRQRRSEIHIRNQAALLDKAQDAIIVRTLSHKIIYWNKGAERLYGWSAKEALGKEIAALLPGDNLLSDNATQAVVRDGEWRGEIVQRHKNGTQFTVEGHWTLVSGDTRHGEQSIFEINTNISHRKIAERKIHYLAYYDSVTGLPNRLFLHDRLAAALERASRTGHPGALLLIDLDNFKTINDTLGHDKGDMLLQEVASRLQANARRVDMVARLGGDEFVMMLEDLAEEEQTAGSQVHTVGEKVLNALSQPFELGNTLHHTSASIGITLFHDNQDQANELLKRADMAMYQAKAAGRNTMRFFSPAMQAAVSRRALLETDLREGLGRNEFVLHYQPQVDSEGRITGAEALVRWQHPQHGLVSPAEFIPLAEDSGLIFPLGLWVLNTACRQLALWANDPRSDALALSVNVSARQFQHPHFVDILLEVLEQTGANPYRLKLELTESLFVTDMEIAAAKMSTLKARGVEFSLDDFGTGYSSLSYLKRLPLKQLKIDQSFVRDILTDSNDAAIAIMIVALARSLGLEVIAEGVESVEQRQFLFDHGCPLYQGYLFSPPVPISRFDTLMAAEVCQ